jgi:hypothetical protein
MLRRHTHFVLLILTVKASNFGPHGNLGAFFSFSEGLAIIETRNEEIKSCQKTSDRQIRFCSFLAHDSSKEAMELANKGPKLA